MIMSKKFQNTNIEELELFNVCIPDNALLLVKDGLLSINLGHNNIVKCNPGDALLIRRLVPISLSLQLNNIKDDSFYSIFDYISLIKISAKQIEFFKKCILLNKTEFNSGSKLTSSDIFSNEKEINYIKIESDHISNCDKYLINKISNLLLWGGNHNSLDETSTYLLISSVISTLLKINKNTQSIFNSCLYSEFARQVATLIRKDISRNWTTDELSNMLGMSTFSFKKKMSREVGSVVYFIRKIKMIEAIELLKTSNLSINKIANLLGFCSSSYFCSVFFGFYHTTPKKIRMMR